MNRRSPFVRKMIYLVAVVALLLVLASLSQPSSIDPSGRAKNPGGKLSQLRDSYGLSQANLGEIDPASETMRLATLGMRGVAVNVLWSKVLHYQKVKDFTSLSATLEQITKLQPNFVRVWIFQGWNLSYNISVDFDDYHDRYYWVIKGINFIKDGTNYNRNEPTLFREIGRTVSQKMGRSDEKVQFRRLFRADDDFHGNRPVGERDSWRVGKEWFRKAEQAVELYGKRMKSGMSSEGNAEGASPLIYLSEAPLCQISYAAAIEEEGTFDQAARSAWQEAARDWLEYGTREIEYVAGQKQRLGDFEFFENRIKELQEKLDQLTPGVRERIRQEKLNALPAEQRAALELPAKERTGETFRLASEAELKLFIGPDEIAVRAEAGEKRKAALTAAAEQLRAMEKRHQLNMSRDIVNYAYWETRCKAEQMPEAIETHRLLYEADKAQADVELESARKLYEQGFAEWRKVLDAFPAMVEDGITGADIVDFTKQYRRCLKELDEEFPEKFVLADVLERHEPFSPATQTATPLEKQPSE